VDFPALAATAPDRGAAVFGPIPQGLLLTRLGLPARIDRLAAGLPAPAAAVLRAGARRLLAPERMGVLFKALALCHPAAPPPPGFAP
ncbi:MAG: class I SAM-dependent methyltransferase, partial [Acetobacteraceae bacterium]